MILYVQTSGVDTPERLYSPFVLAQTAKAMDLDAKIYFLGMGITVVKKGEAEKIKMGTFPSLKEVMDQTIKSGVEILVCEQSTQLLGMKRGEGDGEEIWVELPKIQDKRADVPATFD